MGTTKTDLFNAEQNDLASLFKALAHPARIAILQHLANAESCICADLVQQLGLAQPTISQHLKELKTAGFIKGNVDGVSVCYCINIPVWEQCKTVLDRLFVEVSAKESCC